MKHTDPFMSEHILVFPDVALRSKGKTGFWTASACVTCCSENKVLFPSTHEQTCSFFACALFQTQMDVVQRDHFSWQEKKFCNCLKTK